MKKTNVMRILDQAKIDYSVLEYDFKEGQIDGVSVASKLSESVHVVFKTLVLVGHSKAHYVVMIPVDKTINLKAVAKYFGEKKVEMIHVKDIIKLTGYIRGGCSPLGMKKHFKTVIDDSVNALDYMIYSGGKQGVQIKMSPTAFIDLMKCEIENVVE